MSLCWNQNDLIFLNVDDIIFWIKDTADTNSSAMQLRELDVNLEKEDDVARFLGVTLEWDQNQVSSK
jgi:hypothetical protein